MNDIQVPSLEIIHINSSHSTNQQSHHWQPAPRGPHPLLSVFSYYTFWFSELNDEKCCAVEKNGRYLKKLKIYVLTLSKSTDSRWQILWFLCPDLLSHPYCISLCTGRMKSTSSRLLCSDSEFTEILPAAQSQLDFSLGFTSQGDKPYTYLCQWR